MIELSNDFSVAVRKKRAIKDITKFKLCKDLGISTQTLRKIEKGVGKVNSKTYKKITEWLVIED